MHAFVDVGTQVLHRNVVAGQWVERASDAIMLSITAFKKWVKEMEAAGIDFKPTSKGGGTCMGPAENSKILCPVLWPPRDAIFAELCVCYLMDSLWFLRARKNKLVFPTIGNTE